MTTTDRTLAPGVSVALTARLADRARPAGGRQPVPRFLFAACAPDSLEETRALLTGHLEHHLGPLRCTEVTVEAAVGLDDAAELLADLEANRGQAVETLTPVVYALHQVGAMCEHLGRGEPVLVVASAGALTAQATTTVGAC